jgi:integrase
MRHASVDQVGKLSVAIGERHRALILVAAYGGLRWGELVGLRRHHVNPLRTTITVAEQVNEVNGHLTVSGPKTTAGLRTVALPAFVMRALNEHLDRFAEPGQVGLVFPAARGGYLRRSNFRRRHWLPALKETKLDGLRFHDLRHTAATFARAAGATTKELMERMGHASPAVAMRYEHVMEERDAAIAKGLDKLARGTDGHVKGTQRARDNEKEAKGEAG